jgi:ActR/RegA family two-component response regulator
VNVLVTVQRESEQPSLTIRWTFTALETPPARRRHRATTPSVRPNDPGRVAGLGIEGTDWIGGLMYPSQWPVLLCPAVPAVFFPRPGEAGAHDPATGKVAGHHLAQEDSGRLLWIDDQIDNSHACVRLLVLDGFQVDCAPTSEGGLAIARAHVHDGIVLDQRLPDSSGLTTLNKLRAEGILVPVLFLTAYPDVDVAVSSIRLGAWDFKPKTILLGDDWVTVFRALARAGRSMRAAHVKAIPDLDPDSAALAVLKNAIDEATRSSLQDQRCASVASIAMTGAV